MCFYKSNVMEQPRFSVVANGVTTYYSTQEQIVIEDHDTLPYRGEYEFTPTEDVQTVHINGLRATRNITINPIPSNYGKITWNGSVLTVS